MVAWIVRSAPHPYVVATFDSPAAAETYLRRLPEPIQRSSTVGARDDLGFPCVLIERHTGFEFLNPDEAVEHCRRALDEWVPDEDDEPYGIVYWFAAAYTPMEPGRDEMGNIPHTHPGADELRAIAGGGATHLRWMFGA